MKREINLKKNCKHPNREVFNSVETKGKSCEICKYCGLYLGTIHPLDNLDKSEEPSSLTDLDSRGKK